MMLNSVLIKAASATVLIWDAYRKLIPNRVRLYILNDTAEFENGMKFLLLALRFPTFSYRHRANEEFHTVFKLCRYCMSGVLNIRR